MSRHRKKSDLPDGVTEEQLNEAIGDMMSYADPDAKYIESSISQRLTLRFSLWVNADRVNWEFALSPRFLVGCLLAIFLALAIGILIG